MAEPTQTLISMLDSWFGGAATTLIGAFLGRFLWHANEVKQGKRRMFGKEVYWEIPIAVAMAPIGEALTSFMSVNHSVAFGIVAVLGYLGPKGTEVLFNKWFGAKINKD